MNGCELDRLLLQLVAQQHGGCTSSSTSKQETDGLLGDLALKNVVHDVNQLGGANETTGMSRNGVVGYLWCIVEREGRKWKQFVHLFDFGFVGESEWNGKKKGKEMNPRHFYRLHCLIAIANSFLSKVNQISARGYI